jgi:CheY-like chemotaxis protein
MQVLGVNCCTVKKELPSRPQLGGNIIGKGPFSMTRVLVAEDNAADVYLIREALREHGVNCKVDVAPDGSEVLRMLSCTPSREETLDLIILDLNLPRHDGIEILQRIRDAGLQHIPVVVLTSSDSQRDRQLAIQLGAVRFLRKPSELEQFLNLGAVFKELLENSGAASKHA